MSTVNICVQWVWKSSKLACGLIIIVWGQWDWERSKCVREVSAAIVRVTRVSGWVHGHSKQDTYWKRHCNICLAILCPIDRKIKLVTLGEGNPKSVATTPRCRWIQYSIPWIAPLDAYLIMLSVKQGDIKYHFWVIGMTRPGIEPQSPTPLANTIHSANIYNEINNTKETFPLV